MVYVKLETERSPAAQDRHGSNITIKTKLRTNEFPKRFFIMFMRTLQTCAPLWGRHSQDGRDAKSAQKWERGVGVQDVTREISIVFWD